ncbi:hypothetical protein G6W51_00825 [Streptomyces coelicolor]|nr:hypothetical protein [Streptomyces coelicolor]
MRLDAETAGASRDDAPDRTGLQLPGDGVRLAVGMVSGGCLVGHAAQGIGAPAPGAV